MDSRKSFLKTGMIMIAAFMIPGLRKAFSSDLYKPMKTGEPKKCLVIWYSQAGHTRLYGKLIAKILDKLGLDADAYDIRDIDKSILPNYDLIIIGSPVFYYDTPINVRNWLKSIPNIDGIAVASYVSYGGPEGNQHNAACTILELLADKGGVPVDIGTFVNMSTWPSASWNGPGQIENKHLPNEETYNNVRSFANNLILKIKKGETFIIDRKIAAREFLSILPLAWLTKCLLGTHKIDKNKCIECGTCVKKCPAGAIELSKYKVHQDRCIACFGCINNCPEQAIIMEFMGSEIYGFPEFLRRNKIAIIEPKELKVKKK